ncbi:Eco57I restriction-modification methylase domain-containing protein [Sporomusa acidovorans]|uniref:Eco57I restriction-modification methylase domain-containing protein n=1 Tax=Sporomusa acidovorans TaxID=112900 RepID=UPI002481F08F|nr:TaqI-like C-terminal specificity domain-containing protein [Sporomusa acidovorans]
MSGRKDQADRSKRKATGVFYTPAPIVEYILEHTLEKLDILANPTPGILDPACGSGNFLVAAYDMLLNKFSENLSELQVRYADQYYRMQTDLGEYALKGSAYWCRENLHYHILRHCLYGADLDAGAVSIARERLWEKGEMQEPVATNLVICDSLIKWEKIPEESDGRNDSNGIKLAEFWNRKYDCVIGNPPYVSFGLNRVGKVPAAQSDYLRVNYPQSAQYKLSYYALFFERGISALKPGGYLGFITPDSYLLGRYYSKVRAFILDSCRICELALMSDPVFHGVVVGIPAIAILQKKSGVSASAAGVVAVKKINKAEGLLAVYQYPQDYFSRQVYSRFRLFFNEKDKEIIDKLDQTSCQFGDIAKIRTGMRSLTVQADIKSKSKQSDTWHAGLTSSAQVLPFTLSYQGDWLDVNPAKLNKGGWDKEVMAGRKILLRQTGDRLVAAVDQAGYYHLNNIHSLTVCTTEFSLEYLVAILNSRLMNFYYQTVTLEKGRSLAQVDIEMVEKLPLMIDWRKAQAVTALARQLAELGGYESTEEGRRLFHQLNKEVYAIYGLAADDVLYIEQRML